MKKLPDGSLVTSTHVHMEWRDRSLHAIKREAVVPDPQTASYLKYVLTKSNEMLEGTLISHDVETGLYLGHLSDASESSDTTWSAARVLTP